MTRRSFFTLQFWREYRRDVLRSGRDARARKSLLLRSALLVYFLGVLWWYGSAVYRTHDAATYVLLGVLLLVAAGILVARSIAHRLDDRRRVKADLADTPPGVAQGLQDLAYGALALTERAVSELWLSRHTLPEGYEPAARRIQIDALRKSGTWDTMPSAARQWMMRPDGEWPLQIVGDVLAGAEILHTMLWVLYLAPELRALDSLVKPISLSKTAVALREPARGVRPLWDMRVQRNAAQQYFVRCFAEGVHRGSATARDEEQRIALDEWASGFHKGESPDVFAGDKTISESDAETLEMVRRSAACRTVVLDGAMALMDGCDAWETLTRLVYRPLIEAQTADPETAD